MKSTDQNLLLPRFNIGRQEVLLIEIKAYGAVGLWNSKQSLSTTQEIQGIPGDFIETKKRLGSPSLSLIPVGAYAPRWFMKTNHVNPPEAIQVALDLESKRNFGMHWGTFQLTDEEIMEPPELLKQSLKELGLSEEFFRVLTPGEVVEF